MPQRQGWDVNLFSGTAFLISHGSSYPNLEGAQWGRPAIWRPLRAWLWNDDDGCKHARQGPRGVYRPQRSFSIIRKKRLPELLLAKKKHSQTGCEAERDNGDEPVARLVCPAQESVRGEQVGIGILVERAVAFANSHHDWVLLLVCSAAGETRPLSTSAGDMPKVSLGQVRS